MIILHLKFGHKHGLGHLRRCLNLAREFKKQGRVVQFWFEDSPPEPPWLPEEGFSWHHGDFSTIYHHYGNTRLSFAKESINNCSHLIDTIILDKPYPIQVEEIASAKKIARQVVTIDNGSPGALEADLAFFPLAPLPEQFLTSNQQFSRKIPHKTDLDQKIFAGAEYTIIDKSFLQARNLLSSNEHEDTEDTDMSSTHGDPQNTFNILIAMGGTDAYNLTPKLLKWLNLFFAEVIGGNPVANQPLQLYNSKSKILINKIQVTVVLGPLSQNHNQVMELTSQSSFPLQVLINPSNFALLMAQAQLGIFSFGTIVYEAALLGLPAMLISTFPQNQISAQWLSQYNFFLDAGIHTSLSPKIFHDHLYKLLSQSNIISQMSKNGKKLFDGKGAKRIVDKILC